MLRLHITSRAPWVTIDGSLWLIVGTYGAELRAARVDAVDPATQSVRTASGIVYTVPGEWPDTSSLPRLDIIDTSEMSDFAVYFTMAVFALTVLAIIAAYVWMAAAVLGF